MFQGVKMKRRKTNGEWNEIVNAMKKDGVSTSVYYPAAVPHLTYYREKYGYTTDTFPTAQLIAESSISLPVGPHLDLEDMKTVATDLKKALAGHLS